MRRVRRPARRTTGPLVPGTRSRLRWPRRNDRRRARGRRPTPPAAGNVCRSRRGTVRLLHAGVSGHREGIARREPDADARPDPRGAVWKSVSLHRLSTDLRSSGSRHLNGLDAMSAPKTDLKIIGKPRRRVDGRAKVTGQTVFADDVMLPRMVHCKLLRSTIPHGRIVRIDTARARAHPGVLLVLTGNDFPISYGILPVSQDEHALAVDRVRFVGDPVAAIIARDELTAFDALGLIDVEYEPLPTLSGPEDSLAHPEPRLHEYGDAGN